MFIVQFKITVIHKIIHLGLCCFKNSSQVTSGTIGYTWLATRADCPTNVYGILGFLDLSLGAAQQVNKKKKKLFKQSTTQNFFLNIVCHYFCSSRDNCCYFILH